VAQVVRQMENAGQALVPAAGLRPAQTAISHLHACQRDLGRRGTGAEERVAPSAYGEAFAAAIPHTRFTIVPEAGHMPHWEQPKLVKEATASG
jgi:pimeloyl-ACP methyl ester carboxylesterase